MRRVVAVSALALCLLGCQSDKAPVLVGHDVFFVGADSGGCVPASTYLVGRLVITEDRRLVLQDDQGVMTRVTWRGSLSSRMAGDEVEILDGWNVVATSGRRYKLGGVWSEAFGFWACADVIAQPG